MRLNPRIGGPNALSWPAYWVMVLTSVLISVADPFTQWNSGSWWRNLLCIVLAVSAMFAVMWLLARVLLRSAAEQPRPWRAIGIFAVGAIVRALALAALLPTLGDGAARPAYRLISSLVILVPLLAFMSGLMDLIRTSAARRAALVAEGHALRTAEQDAVASTADLEQNAITRVRALLMERLDAMRGGRASDMGEDLRHDVEQVIRPLSHRLAAAEGLRLRATPSAGRARIAWTEVWRSATLGMPFRPALLASVAVIASANGLATYTGNPLRGLGYAVAEGFFIAAIFTLLARTLAPAMRHLRTGPRTMVFVSAAIAGMVVAGLLLGWLIVASGGQNAWNMPISIMVFGPWLAWAIAIDQGYRRQVAATDADLVATNARLQMSAAVAGSVLRHEERLLSRALHGPIQAAVTAAAMRVEAGDEAGAEALLVDALGHLDADAAEQRLVGDALAEVATAWDGLCTVTADIEPAAAGALDENAPVAASFIDICTEACSNAVRHGGARSVLVHARRDDSALMLVVSDDGVPGDAESQAGLGSALLDDVTLSWQRTREGERTVLRATMPLAA